MTSHIWVTPPPQLLLYSPRCLLSQMSAQGEVLRPSPALGCSFATLLLPHRMGTPPLPAGCTFRQASRHLHLQFSALLLPLSLLATHVSLLLFLKPTLLPLAHAPACFGKAGKGKKDKVWTFDYSQYLAIFRACAQDLCLNLVPYQARHPGSSIDRAINAGDQDEVRKRGGWMTKSSVIRYEKAGRLAATWQKLDPSIQQCCRTAE